MSGPWEQYATTSTAPRADGPWTAYQPSAPSSQPKKRDFGIDWSKPVPDVRSAISSLPEADRQEALNQWADSYVSKERESSGVTGAINGGVRALARGTLLGSFLDEATAVTSAGLNTITGGYAGAPYDETVAYQRAKDRAFDKANPVTSTALQLAGGVASAVPILKPAQTLLGASARGAAYGTAAGGIHGAGEGATTQERLDKATTGATAGAVLGAVIPPAIAGGVSAYQAAKSAVNPALTRFRRGPEEAADVIMARQMQRAGHTPQTVADDLAKGDHARTFGSNSQAPLPEIIADTSDAMQRLTGSVYRAGGEAGEMVKKVLTERQVGPANRFERTASSQFSGQMDDIGEAFDRALQITGQRGGGSVMSSMLRSAKQEGNRLYNEAFTKAEPFDLMPAMQGLVTRAAEYPPQFAMKLRKAASQFDNVLSAKSHEQALLRFDNGKKGLDDMIEAAQRGGHGQLSRELTIFKNDILDAVHAVQNGLPTRNAAYAEARSAWGSAAENREAIEKGRAALNNPSQALEEWLGLSKGQQTLFRIGLRDGLKQALASKRPGNDTTLFFQQRGVSDLLREVIPTSKKGAAAFADRAERFGEYMNRQQRMVQTKNAVLGNSMTAQRQSDDAQLGADALGQMWQRFRSSPSLSNMVLEASAAGLSKVFGFRQDVAAALARRLTETDPVARAAILQKLSSSLGPDKTKEIVDHLILQAQRFGRASVNTAVSPSMASAPPQGR